MAPVQTIAFFSQKNSLHNELLCTLIWGNVCSHTAIPTAGAVCHSSSGRSGLIPIPSYATFLSPSPPARIQPGRVRQDHCLRGHPSYLAPASRDSSYSSLCHHYLPVSAPLGILPIIFLLLLLEIPDSATRTPHILAITVRSLSEDREKGKESVTATNCEHETIEPAPGWKRAPA